MSEQQAGEWVVVDHDRDNRKPAPSRSKAEEMAETAREFGSDDVEVKHVGKDTAADGDDPNNDSKPQGSESDTDGAEPVDAEVIDHAPDAPDHSEEYANLPDRDVGEDPLTWMPGEFIDTIDGAQAINRKGFEVLSHFYDIDVQPPEVMVSPHDSDHTYCQVRATVVTGDGRECSALGSAHVDRGDDPELLLEMADTRARKRALSIATGVGAVAVEELKNEVEK